MVDDIEYLRNSLPNRLYVNPNSQGAYAQIIGEGEEVIGEFNISEKNRIVVKAFFVNKKKDFNSFKIIKLKKISSGDWQEVDSLALSKFDAAKMKQLIGILSVLDLEDTNKTRIDLGKNTSLENLEAFLGTEKSNEFLQELSQSTKLQRDIYAIATKRQALREFEQLLQQNTDEPIWQSFFDRNTWIFGYGLNYVTAEKVFEKLEAVTTGSTAFNSGKRADGLIATNAKVSQFVLVEIKKSNSEIFRKKEYRPGVWGPTTELTNAISQSQKTIFEFSQKRFKETIKDQFGNDTLQKIYAVQPKSYLVYGDMSEIIDNNDKITCFELLRKNTNSPEIITFDELYYRAKFIVENLETSAIS